MIETIIENTLSNILTEAFNNEFNITARPRLIALPPKIQNNPNPFMEMMIDQEQNRSSTNSQLKLKANETASNSSPDLTIRSGANTANAFK
jgi:hypothetical protein